MGLLGVVIAIFIWISRANEHAPHSPSAIRPIAKRDSAAALSSTAAPAALPDPTPDASKALRATTNPKATTFTSFQLRPFAVTQSSGSNAWTAEDGRSPDAIRRLAHNELEVERLTAENDKIKRRQLVYCTETIASIVQSARSKGKPVDSFIVPALDGMELAVEVTQNYLEPVVTAGSLIGHLKDRPNSVVSIGFKDGYESFNILSPDDGLYIVADAREPGEVMVKEIIPEVYGATPAAADAPDFILTK